MTSSQHTHFEGKDALTHVQDKRQEASTEIHGQETAGHLAAALDSTRETAIFLLILWAVIFPFTVGFLMLFWILLLATIGWVIWKTGRSAWLAWSRLERLHRVMEQERWEITHHRKPTVKGKITAHKIRRKMAVSLVLSRAAAKCPAVS